MGTGPENKPIAKDSCTYVLKWQRLGWKPEKGSIFNTGPYGEPPLKIKMLKIGLQHVLSWPKLGLEPKFHESGTFGGFGKPAQSLSRILNTGPYGDPPPLKNQNFENRASS